MIMSYLCHAKMSRFLKKKCFLTHYSSGATFAKVAAAMPLRVKAFIEMTSGISAEDQLDR